ncbi:MAG: hypothetical protein IKS23_04285 [Alphaproteobacteria bacterium]|nr:hypothetical protein [Alphaproteobacteria bacterium]
MNKKILTVAMFFLFILNPVFGKDMAQKDIHNQMCSNLCGSGYFYDRPGAKRNGQELVCTKYPLSCGYKCTIGWTFKYLINGTNYTCQEAIQFEPTEEDPNLIKARSL